MKLLTLFKILAIGMGLLIIVGTFLVVSKIAKSDIKSKRFPNDVSEINLTAQEKIDYIVGCGEYICAITKRVEEAPRLLVIVPKTGKIQSVVRFKEKQY